MRERSVLSIGPKPRRVIAISVAFIDISLQLRCSAGLSPGRVERSFTALSQNAANAADNHTDWRGGKGFVAYHVDFNS